jgi:hypothetical protein
MTYYLVVTFLSMGISNVYIVLIGFGLVGQLGNSIVLRSADRVVAMR